MEAELVGDFWMGQADVAEVCPDCALKMANLNVRRIRASVLFGADNPELIIEAARNRTAAKGDKWKKLPKGWTDKSRKKMWDSLTGDAKHKVTACIKKMEGKVDDPGAFCASLADRVDKGWRSEGREARLTRVAIVTTGRQMEEMFEQTLIALNQIEASAEDFGFSPDGAAQARKVMLRSYQDWTRAKRNL